MEEPPLRYYFYVYVKKKIFCSRKSKRLLLINSHVFYHTHQPILHPNRSYNVPLIVHLSGLYIHTHVRNLCYHIFISETGAKIIFINRSTLNQILVIKSWFIRLHHSGRNPCCRIQPFLCRS